MLKVNVAGYLIHNLAGMNYDNNEAAVAQTIDMLVDSWSDNRYLSVQPNLEYHINPDQVNFGKTPLRAVTNC